MMVRGVLAVLLALCLQPVLAGDPIRVGVTVSLTGGYAAPGGNQLRGIQMWVDDLNARGALLGQRVELVHYDDQSDAARSALLYEQLITEDRVDLLLGPYSSDLTMEASRVAEQHNFPMVATGAGSDRIWGRGYSNIFGVDTPASAYMNVVLESASKAGLSTLALVASDAEFTREVAEGVRARAAENNMEIVFDAVYHEGAADFSGLVQRMKAARPDIVLGGTYLNDSVTVIREAKRQNFAPKAFIFTVGPALVEFGEMLGADAEGVMGVVAWTRDVRLPKAQDFSYRYKRRFGSNAGVHAAYGYGAGQVLEAAVRLAGSPDRDAVRQQLASMKFRSLLGHYRVDGTGKQLGKATYGMQWQDGRRRLVLPKNLREGEIEYPFTPWSER